MPRRIGGHINDTFDFPTVVTITPLAPAELAALPYEGLVGTLGCAAKRYRKGGRRTELHELAEAVVAQGVARTEPFGTEGQ
jgi:hypothetical protein